MEGGHDTAEYLILGKEKDLMNYVDWDYYAFKKFIE